ncbi:MAG: glycosyltransferase family 4 protein [Bacteroidales bacterium]|nr:glycosyltransferase family 4 protein [Bacteroidales bacterium]
MTLAIIASWSLVQSGKETYIPTTHYVYLNYVAGVYEQVYLISPLSKEGTKNKGKALGLPNVKVVPLPFNGSYFGALKNWKAYYKTLQHVRDKVDVVYCRVPDPFSWMPALLFKKKTIMHFVGDTIDATQHNEKWSWLKKKVMIAGYLPDYWLTLRAAKRSRVYTNGYHLANRLVKYGIKATPVISSTVSEKDLHDDFTSLPLSNDKVVITYIGYVRFAKGMNCLMEFCKRLKDEEISFLFNLIGDGEMFDEVKAFIEKENLSEVIMHGHIDSKERMNEILRTSDLFFFPSLSEGSPRVVVEAMAQGTPVMSTPVGSLPTTFTEKESIRFFDFNDAKGAVDIVKEYLQNPKPFETQRNQAYKMVAEQFTIEKFLSNVFCYEA